jgi:signal transduction histidine kinase
MQLFENEKLLILVMIGIFATVYVLLFYFEITNGAEINQSLVEQQSQRQGEAVQVIASNIASDLDSVLGRLQDLAIVKSRLSASQSDNELQSLYMELFNKTFADNNDVVDILFEVNSSGIITQWAALPDQQSFLGANVSFREYVKETASSKAPVYSGMFRGLDGTNRVVITYPILGDPSGIYANSESDSAAATDSNSSRNYLGLLAISMPVNFFQRYGNTHDVETQYIAMLDKNGTFMLTPRAEFIGKSFFGTDFQRFISGNQAYNNLVDTVMSGRPDNGNYSIGKEGEYLNSGYPIFLGTYTDIYYTSVNSSNTDRPQYSVFVITPFHDILSNVDEAVSKDRLHTIVLLAALSVAVALVFVIFYRWYKSLANKVKWKTGHLIEANQRLQVINEKLVANEKAKEEFISMVSHELRTPLTPIKAFAEMLLKPKYMNQAVLNEKQNKAVTSIVHNIKILEKLVSDVLDTYRIEMSRLKLSQRSVDVSELVNENISNFNPLTSEKGITFESDIRTDGGTRVYCDPERIGQVLGNLVKNSIDFVPEGGKITIRTEEYLSEPEREKGNVIKSELNKRIVQKEGIEAPGRFAAIVHEAPHHHFFRGNNRNDKSNTELYQSVNHQSVIQKELNVGAGQAVAQSHKPQQFVLFTVEDNGVGFPQDKIDNLFQKFYQIDTSLTRKHGGTGLGLVICKGIVEAHGGMIWIDKDYTQGAAVKFTLPATEDTSKKSASASIEGL